VSTTLFQPRTRVKEAREAIRSAPDLEHGESVNDVVMELLLDLARDLARRRPGSEEEAYAFVLRCMGAIAMARAADIYEPYGYDDPFLPMPPAAPVAPPEPVWKWPVIDTGPSSGAGIAADRFSPFSALKMFGYTVGRTNGWPKAKRESFLSDFMRLELPPVVKSTFGDEYGRPMTTTRLRKVANVIAANASNFHRNDAQRYAAAVADWASDLAYLKQVFYIGAGLAFHPWPEPDL
jgi:hypothetical protein